MMRVGGQPCAGRCGATRAFEESDQDIGAGGSQIASLVGVDGQSRRVGPTFLFSMIDHELFMGIKPEEFIIDDWTSCQEVHVLYWVQCLKDRAEWKVESRHSHKTGVLAAVRVGST